MARGGGLSVCEAWLAKRTRPGAIVVRECVKQQEEKQQHECHNLGRRVVEHTLQLAVW